MSDTTFTVCSFANVNGASVDLGDTDKYRIVNLDWRYEYAGDPDPKQQDSGNKPSNSFVRQLTMNLVVKVRGTGDTPDGKLTDYWSNRQSLMEAFLVDDGAQTNYEHGTLTIQPAGLDEIYAKVHVTDFEVPSAVDELGAKMSTVTIQLRADRAYWLATADDTVVKV